MDEKRLCNSLSASLSARLKVNPSPTESDTATRTVLQGSDKSNHVLRFGTEILKVSILGL